MEEKNPNQPVLPNQNEQTLKKTMYAMMFVVDKVVLRIMS